MNMERGPGIEPSVPAWYAVQQPIPPRLERTQGVEPCTYGLEGRRIPTNTWLALPLILALSGCSSQPTVGPPVYIKQTVYIPVPATLTQPISIDLTGATWGKAVGDLKAGLDTCNANLGAISGLKVPLTPAPPKP